MRPGSLAGTNFGTIQVSLSCKDAGSSKVPNPLSRCEWRSRSLLGCLKGMGPSNGPLPKPNSCDNIWEVNDRSTTHFKAVLSGENLSERTDNEMVLSVVFGAGRLLVTSIHSLKLRVQNPD